MTDYLQETYILLFDSNEDEFNKQFSKSIPIVRAKGQQNTMKDGFIADSNKKKKYNVIGMQYFALVCKSRAFIIIKGKTITDAIVKALLHQYELNKPDKYVKLLEQFMSIKLKSSKDNQEWLILKIEEIDLKMCQINSSYGKRDKEKRLNY